MDRELSSSGQRLRTLLRGAHHEPVGSRIEQAFKSEGLKVKSASVQQDGGNSGYTLAVKGWHSDGSPFAFVTAPFTGDPVERAKQAAADEVKKYTGTKSMADTPSTNPAPTAIGTATTATPKATNLASRIKGLASKLDSGLVARTNRLEALEQREAKIGQQLDSAMSQRDADLTALENVANQLSNGE